MNKIFFFSILYFICYGLNAKFIPADFEHLYEHENREINIELPNGTIYRTFALINYNGIKSVESKDDLLEKIVNSGVSEDYVSLVYNNIISDDENCSLGCDDISKKYDYDSRKMKISVPYYMLSNEKSVLGYTTQEPSDNAIISSNRAFANYYDGSNNFSLSNQTTIGLGQGFLYSDLNINYNDSGSSNYENLDLSQVKYEYDINGHAFDVGYNKYNIQNNNSTSNLDYAQTRNKYYVSLYSSDNLLMKDRSNYKNLYFDMKNKGLVEIYRGNTIIYSSYFQSGQNSISYRDLPKGNYNIKIILYPDGMPVETLNQIISNNASKTSLNGYDYKVSFNNVELNKDDQNTTTLNYIETLLTHELQDSLLIGFGVKSDVDNYNAGVMIDYTKNDFGFNSYYEYMEDASFLNFGLFYSSFNFDYQTFDSSEDNNDLIKALYSDSYYEQISASYNHKLFSGNVMLYGSKLSREFNDISSINYNFSVNYSRLIFTDTSFNVGYSLNKNIVNRNDNEDVDHVVTASITIPLGRDISNTTLIEANSNGERLLMNTLSDDNLYTSNDNSLKVKGDVSSFVSGTDSKYSLSSQMYLNERKYNANAYINVDSNGHKNASGTFETTLVSDYDGVYFSSSKEQSYIIVENDGEFDDNNDLGLINIKKNDSHSETDTLAGDYNLIGLDEYNLYNFDLDTEISGYKNNSDSSGLLFSYPGTVAKSNNMLKKTLSFVTYFEDFNGNSLNDIKCLGEGCNSISRVGNGIYSINLLKGKQFKIASGASYCELDLNTGLDSDNYTNKCFPVVSEDEQGLKIVKSGLGANGEQYYYLGEFYENIPRAYENELQTNNIEVEYFEFNKGKKFIFAKTENTRLTDKQYNSLMDLSKYVFNKDSGNKEFITKVEAN